MRGILKCKNKREILSGISPSSSSVKENLSNYFTTAPIQRDFNFIQSVSLRYDDDEGLKMFSDPLSSVLPLGEQLRDIIAYLNHLKACVMFLQILCIFDTKDKQRRYATLK